MSRTPVMLVTAALAAAGLAAACAVPSWSALRGTQAGAVFAAVAAQAGAGGGDDVAAVLADCDASHVREVEYATRLGLTPSR